MEPSWSPDGTKIAFTSKRDGNPEIYTMNADGSGVRRLTNNPRDDSDPDWSSDGTKIAFETNLTNSSFPSYFPSWQPIPRCTITGTQGNDKLRGTAGKDVICGLAGNDTLSGWEGDDILIGGKGGDAMYGGADNDTLNGGPGTDAGSFLGAATAVAASLTTNFATGQGSDVFVGIEDLAGTAFGDTLEGSNSANVLEGLGGNDALKVREGQDNDTANGGSGSDTCQRDPGDTVRSRP